jgi:hypothetical protein
MLQSVSKGYLVNEIRGAKDENAAMTEVEALIGVMRTFSK